MFKLKKAIAFLLALMMTFSCVPGSLAGDGDNQVTDTVQNKDVVLTPKEGEPEEAEKAELLELASEDLSVSPLSAQRLEELKGMIPPAGDKKGNPNGRGIKLMSRGPQPVTNTYTGFAAFEISPKEEAEAEQYDVNVRLGSPIALLETPETVIDSVTCELYHFHTDEKGSTSVDRITADSGNLNVAWENNEITGFSFSTGDFSEFVLTYTVVYHYEDKEFTCTLPGAKDIPLVQILTGLEIVSAENADEFLAGILNVEVSDADVFRLTNDEEGWKFRVLKESKEPQTLTVTQQNGRKYVITVAAAGNTELTTEDNQATISTVNGYYLPEEASAYAEILTDEQAGGAISAVQGLNGNEQAGSDAAWQAFSIGLNNVDRNEYEGFDVNVNLTEDLSGRDFRLYQVQNGQAEDITESLQLNADTRSDGSRDVHGFSFTTDEFAEYVLCYSLVTYYTTVDGATYRITLSYGRKADIPDGAELKVTEITENQENYARYVADSAARLGVSSEDVTFARFFDIEIQKDGKKIEPKAPVDVTIAYVDGMPLEGNAKLSVVHFGDEGTEVIPEVSVTDDNREITYQQGSFSVTGTIITAGSAGKHYAIIVKNGDKYYSVRTDGSLDEVEYSPETNEADIDYPLFWTYASENVDNSVTQSGNQTVNLLRMESSAAHIGDWAQPDDWYYYYIDPTVTAGITLEPALNPVPKPWDYSKAKKHHQEYHWQCALVYENNQIKSRNNNLYIGIDEDKHCIKGGASQEEAATIYLAEVKSVPNSNNLNHTVNHIDISIRGKVKLTVPLAYGDYTYVDENGETHTLHVDQDMDLELESTVPITIGDVKKAELTAFSKKTGKVLNNAFYITGYSQNTTDETDYSNPQVRIEGSFKVADLEPYGQDQLDSRLVRPANVNDQTPDNECQIINEESPKDYLQQRLDNRIYYTVTVNKDLEFPWIYKDKGTGHYGQLKNSSGLLSSKITLNLSKTFDYWDPKNECPPMYKPSFNGVTDEDMAYWRAGHILWNTSSKQGSGMDFVLDVESTSDPDVIAIEIKKKILTKSGEIIHPEEPVSNRFIVYQKTGTVRADWDSVIDVGVPGSNKAANYNDFSGIHTKSIIVGEPGEGLVNDYDIQPGMIYIEEEKDSVPSVITDTQGREWHYSDTKIETEYVWRPSPVVIPESGVHTADGFKSIPEVVGNYGTWNDNGTVKELKNRFLEFTVYNVYVPPEPVKKEVEPHAGTGLLGNVKVGQDITYEIDYYNYMDPTTTVVVKDKLDKNVKFKSAEPANLAEYDENTHTVTWTIKNAPVGEGYVRLTVEVLPGAEVPAAGHEIGSVINQGTTVKVGNDKEVTLEPVENPVPEKQETGATRNGTALEGDYKGTGLLGFVKVGDEITYKINYRNYQKDKATVTIVDTLDKNVAYVKSVPAGTYDNAEHKVTWSLAEVEASAEGYVTLTVKVLPGAEVPAAGHEIGSVINQGTTVKVGNDKEVTLEPVENPVPEKQETGATRNGTALEGDYKGTGLLGFVKVGDEITYKINYRNYKKDKATVTIVDTLDKNVAYVKSVPAGTYDNAEHKVTWSLAEVEAGAEGSVTLTVKVLPGAEVPAAGHEIGSVINQGTTVKVGNDKEVTLEPVENPVPEKQETGATRNGTALVGDYEGTGLLGFVKVGDEITYKINYRNYQKDKATVTIVDTLDKNVAYVKSVPAGTYDNAEHKVTWSLAEVEAGAEGSVTLTVKVLPGAEVPAAGHEIGSVINQGTTVKVGNDKEVTLEPVENPVPEKQETGATRNGTALEGDYKGTGLLGFVKVGDEITYKINYQNYKKDKATVTIVDTLDKNVAYVKSVPEGTYDTTGHKVTWSLAEVAAGAEGYVTLTVKVLPGAEVPAAGHEIGSVINQGTTVKVGNDNEVTLEPVENPVPEKKETGATRNGTTLEGDYEGTGLLGFVKVGDEITYKINYQNYKKDKATVTIVDTLDSNVAYVESVPEGTYDTTGHKVTWSLAEVAAGAEGYVTLTVKVLPGAEVPAAGHEIGSVINQGTTVKVGNDKEVTLEPVENPVPEKQETGATRNGTALDGDYKGTGLLGFVKVGDEITYKINYRNYKKDKATVTIVDTLDKNVAYVKSVPAGTYDNAEHKVTWSLAEVAAGAEGYVTLTVKVLPGAEVPAAGHEIGSVINQGTTVKVGNDKEVTLEPVENPVPEKQEAAPYEGSGVLGAIHVGDEITYEITYRNYKADAATVTIKDKLDKNVEFISASDNGTLADGVVTWTLADVPAGKAGKVTLTVKVLPGALVSNDGAGKVVNGGDSTTVKVGNDNEYTVETVENPVPEDPEKKETKPYEGTGLLGFVHVGDEITYEINYKNYKTETSTVVIKDTLDTNVQFVDASKPGTHSGENHGGIVNWTLADVPAGQSGTVTLTVKVLPGALVSNGGTGSVINGGDTATVKVGNDAEFTLNPVENPVPEKKETKPYEGTGLLGFVKVGDEITYEITYRNYKTEAATVTVKDKLDKNVEFISASDNGALADGVVTWTLADVPAGKSGVVTLTVKVLPGALVSNGGTGSVINGGDTATVKVGNDAEFTLNPVENPVPEKKETKPYEGTGLLGNVHVGDEITYEISYRNYKTEAATVTIKDKLDKNVEFISASDKGTLADGVVTWTLADVPAGQTGTVTLKVKVLPGALVSNGGTGSVINGGDTATVKVGNDKEFTLNPVENPIPEKKETKPYEGTGLLGNVHVGDEITYEISYRNYKTEAATVTIKDKLDRNVEFISASDKGTLADGTVTWTLADVPAGKSGVVTLTVKVLPGALVSNGGTGSVINGGDTATVKVGNDAEFTLNPVENPVPEKKETKPYEGTGLLGFVKVGDEITYEISYRNYKTEAATVTIKDKLDKNVEFISASDKGALADGVVTWTLADVPAGKSGTVTLTVKVLPGALVSNGGTGSVINGGDTATVKVGNDAEFTLNPVENPVPEKKETKPYEGTGLLGFVKVGDEITYEISYRNYKTEAATVTIKDKLDKNVEFISASDKGTFADGTVTWTLADVPAGKSGTVTLTVKVLPGALVSNGGTGSVVNGGDTATVKVGNDAEFTLNPVENPVPEKKETKPYEGTGLLGFVKVGDEITYEISYRNYKTEAATVTIKDKLDKNVAFVSASDNGTLADGTVTWTLADVPAGQSGTVTLTVKVLPGALVSNGGTGSVINGGDTATVKVGNDAEFTLNPVENPVPEKKETKPYEGTGLLGNVHVGDEITYEISYRNYKTAAATVTIKDKLDKNVAFVSASDNGALADGVVTWTLADVPAGKSGVVTLTVKVLPGALVSNGGTGSVINGGDTATVKVGNDKEFTLNPVENPIPEKKETKPYEGTGLLGNVHVGDEITYEISYRNYKTEAATVTVKDKLDKNVEFISASDNGALADGVVTWTLADVPAGKSGVVTLTVKVLPGALVSNGGTGSVINGGDTATVKVGNDAEFTLNPVENPVPEKKETKPYEGTGLLGAVKVGDEITYEISYRNYKTAAATVTVKDKLDKNVEFISASDNGALADGVVTWTLADVPAGKSGVVTLTVKVLPGALVSNGGTGSVINGGDTATVKVGNDNEFTLNTVENPVPEDDKPHKKEITPYEGNGVLGAVKVGDEITYQISYRNYKTEAATVTIRDKLDRNVEFVSASNGGAVTDGVVNWTLADVPAETAGAVTLTVKVLPGALVSNSGLGKVVNNGETATVKIGNDDEISLETVENPVPEEPHKKEITPYEGIGMLGLVDVGDEITYEISYINYKTEAATVVIRDRLDENVEFVSADQGGVLTDGVVVWTIPGAPAGKAGSVKLTVRVLEGAKLSLDGPGKVVNGGETATVKIGNDNEFALEVVENPLPELPHKKEVAPYEGTGALGAVKVGDHISYEITYTNYLQETATVVIKDKLDTNVNFISCSYGGELTDGVVIWAIPDVAPGKSGSVFLTVEVLESALVSHDGPGIVVNGGKGTTVKVGNENAVTLERVSNPVPTVSVTVTKIWDDNNNEANLRPENLRVTLSTGDEYYLNEENGWTVTVDDLPKYDNAKLIEYTWSEQSVTGYTRTGVKVEGSTTTFTNRCVLKDTPKKQEILYEFDDMPTPLGLGICMNHVGDNFE